MSFCLDHDSLNFLYFKFRWTWIKVQASVCLPCFICFNAVLRCASLYFYYVFFFFSPLTLPAMVLLYWRTFWPNSRLLVLLWFFFLQVAFLEWISTASEESLQGLSVAVMCFGNVECVVLGWLSSVLSQCGDSVVVAGTDTCLWSCRMLPAMEPWEELPWAHLL